MNDLREIGRLVDVSVREAWQWEARAFTPWLAQHLDQLGTAVGMTLELEGTEVAVGTFYADILARNPTDDSRVLIENQLEMADHAHLGQILTYLTGLEAKTVIWIATQFRETHLSAVNWLNEHTVEPFSFFAVKLRVVRIADSPPAPIFEVLSRPNNWDRHLQQVAGENKELSERGVTRKEFWSAFFARFPDELQNGGKVPASSAIWYEVEPRQVVVVLWLGREQVGVYVRGWRGSDGSELYPRLAPHDAQLKMQLNADIGSPDGRYFLGSRLKLDMAERANWPRAIDWLHETKATYVRALTEILQQGSPGQ